MTTLRDQLQVARINRLEVRMAKAWAARQPDCQCPLCQIKRGLVAGVRMPADDEAPAPVPASHH